VGIVVNHLHSISAVYPVLAAPVLLTANAGVYADFPTPTEIIPAGVINYEFCIHWITCSAISANGDYVIRLYQGLALAETTIATVSVVRNAVQSQEGSSQVINPLLAANTRISAAIASGNAGADTLAVKVQYNIHTAEP
jgi:hypothetical protein